MRIVLLCCCCFWLGWGSGQTTKNFEKKIFLTNASFEGPPQDATVPVGWFPCAPGTTPDILPGHWGVYTEASEGETFMGLITREDGSFESVGQRLPEPLAPNECYTFTLDLAHSRTYADYNQPIRLRIWGSQGKCGQEQVIFLSDFIRHADWKTYEVNFTLKNPVNYIIIEAFYQDGKFSHRGNILVDKISPIKKCIRA